MSGVRGLVVAAVLVLAGSSASLAGEPRPAFGKGTTVWSIEAGAGNQDNVERHARETDLDLVLAGVRVGLLPTEPLGTGALRVAVELGLEAIFQRYTDPVSASFQGLGAMGRFHFLGLGLGRVVPYFEMVGAAGATDLAVREIDSDFTFWVAGGVGVSLFVTEQTAVYVGYRLVHVSNGNTDSPNRGLEAHTGVIGVSFFQQ
jgi:opacity protein-like surface antigen